MIYNPSLISGSLTPPAPWAWPLARLVMCRELVAATRSLGPASPPARERTSCVGMMQAVGDNLSFPNIPVTMILILDCVLYWKSHRCRRWKASFSCRFPSSSPPSFPPPSLSFQKAAVISRAHASLWG